MIINGKQFKLIRSISLVDFLRNENYDLERIAVEKNGNIVSKQSFEKEILTDDDKIEIVQFVGGG